jgi:hypothetical protein
MGYVPGVMATGFDPQSALYNQQYQKATDAAKASAAQSGLAGSPFAAGMTADAGQNFNLNWQDQQQARQAAAIAQLAQLFGAANQGETTGVNNANTLSSGASDAFSKGLDTLYGSTGAPASTYDTQQNQTMDALKSLVAALTGINSAQGTNTDLWAKYLGLGQSSTQIADQATQYNNQSSFMGGLGSLLGTIGQIGSMSTGGGGTIFGDLGL